MRLKKLGQEDFTGMDGRELQHGGHLLVVIDDLDVERVGGAPDEADAPLVVDADAVLTRTGTFESLEVIAWRNTKVGERVSGINDDELSQCCALKCRRQTARATAMKERFRVEVAEGSNHARK